MTTIHLHKVILFAHHGIYEEEKINGNTFEVNLDVKYNEKGSHFEHISETIDYEVLYRIISEKMAEATPLIETVCVFIADAVKARFPSAREVTISIYKLRPPIKDFEGRAGVTIQKIFDD